MVSPGEPKTIRLLEGGLVLRDGSIVDRPDERFVPRVRALQRRRCDRVRSVRVRPQQNVPGGEGRRYPRGLARPVEGADGRGEAGTAARPGRARRRRGRRGEAVRLPPGRDPTVAFGGAAGGPFRLRPGRRDPAHARGAGGRGTDSGPRDARAHGRPEDDPDLRADVRRGDVCIRGRFGCRLHVLPDVRESLRPIRALPDCPVRRDRRGRHARGAPALPNLEQRGGPGSSPRQTGAVPRGVGALRAGDPAGPAPVVRLDVPRGRDAVPRPPRRGAPLPRERDPVGPGERGRLVQPRYGLLQERTARESPRLLRQGDSYPPQVRDRVEQQGRRVCAHGPIRGRGQVPHESDEAPAGIRRGVAEPRRSARPSGRPRRSAKVPGARAIDFTHPRGLETSYGENVNLRAGGGGCGRLDAFHGLEALADSANEISVAVSLEKLHQEPAVAAQRANRKGERRIREVEGPGHIERPVAAEFWSHVAHDNVRGLAERLEQLSLDLRSLEVATKDLHALDRGHLGEVDSDDAPPRPNALAGHLGPAARRGPQVHDDTARFEQAIPEVNLGQLDRGAAAVRLLLRGAVESIVLPGLDPSLAHYRNEEAGAP